MKETTAKKAPKIRKERDLGTPTDGNRLIRSVTNRKFD